MSGNSRMVSGEDSQHTRRIDSKKYTFHCAIRYNKFHFYIPFGPIHSGPFLITLLACLDKTH